MLPENESRKDARTLDKLIDGNNLDFTHSWLAPFTETNAIFVCFDAAVAISRLTLWNYANACVEINQCVRCPSWLGRAVRNRHRHAIEHASRRWRGDDAMIQHERAVKF